MGNRVNRPSNNEDDSNKENINPQPNPLSDYVPGMSRELTFPGVRDRGIINFQEQRDFRRIQWRIIHLTRYMDVHPFPGDAVIEDYQLYFGLDYDRHHLEHYLWSIERDYFPNFYCNPMNHEEYLLMRTASLSMMRTMLIEIPGVFDDFPALWYTFGTMGQLLDACENREYVPLVGQLKAANNFFFVSGWFPIVPRFPEPFPILARRF